jgi:cytochrome oxidase Cu insertion factor (SCO1/SenC/PrrC family)
MIDWRHARWQMMAGVAMAATVAGCRKPAPEPLPILGTVPAFVLEDQTQQPIDLGDLRGSVWVASLFSTTCTGPCATESERMAGLATALASDAALRTVKLVSFSVDATDGDDALRQYARVHGVDPARWMLLTGTADATQRVLRDGFHLPPDSRSFVVVDRQGRVRGTYDALADEWQAKLHAALENVSGEAATDVFAPRGVQDPWWLAARAKAQIASASSLTVPHDFHFTDRLGTSGITFRHQASTDVGRFYTANHYDHGTGVAAADVDGDGLIDLYFANQAGPGALFRNLGHGRFEDITERAGVRIGGRACTGVAFADIDNDGDPDLYVSCVRAGNVLFQNDGHGVFSDITASSGVGGFGAHSSGVVFFDYDNDGLLDLFVTNVGKYTRDDKRADGLYASQRDAFAGHLHPDRSETSLLYHNLGHGRFENATMTSGLVHAAWSGEATAFDADADGRPDLYVLSMQGHDEFWRNAGGGHFERRSRQVFPATPWGAMGAQVLDWNGDGRFDLYVTDMHTDMSSDLKPEEETRKHDPKTFFPPDFLGTDQRHVLGNALFTNHGGLAFVEESDKAGAETGWPWGPSVGDLNADGWPDIFVAAGMNYPFRYRGSDVLLNQGGTRFAPAEYILGVEPRRRLVVPWMVLDCDGADVMQDICTGENEPLLAEDTRTPDQRGKGAPRHGQITVWAARASRSAVLLDLDDDGDLDIVTSNYGDVPQVLMSDLSQRGPVHFLKVKLVGRRSNRDGIGAVVTVQANGRSQALVNDGKTGYLAQGVVPLYVGLGAADHADAITIKWPSGGVQTVRGPHKSGSLVAIREP